MIKIGRPSHLEAVASALPGTRNQIAKRVGISAACAGRLLRVLDEKKAIYVVTHAVPKQGPKMPIFALKRQTNG
jgi:ribosomal protein S25